MPSSLPAQLYGGGLALGAVAGGVEGGGLVGGFGTGRGPELGCCGVDGTGPEFTGPGCATPLPAGGLLDAATAAQNDATVLAAGDNAVGVAFARAGLSVSGVPSSLRTRPSTVPAGTAFADRAGKAVMTVGPVVVAMAAMPLNKEAVTANVDATPTRCNMRLSSVTDSDLGGIGGKRSAPELEPGQIPHKFM